MPRMQDTTVALQLLQPATVSKPKAKTPVNDTVFKSNCNCCLLLSVEPSLTPTSNKQQAYPTTNSQLDHGVKRNEEHDHNKCVK